MSAGDYIIRKNSSVTTAIPATGSDLLLDWPTAEANVGSGITHSAGVITLGETGHFLVMCSEHYRSADNTNNERINAKMTFTLAGVELVEGYSTGYLRKNNTALLDYINFSAAIINVTSTTGNADELEVRLERTDDVVITGPVRVVDDLSSITIIKLDDTLDYARYQSSAVRATSATDNVRTVMNLQTQDEQDASFIRTTDTIEIDATDDLVLAVYSVKSEAGSGTTRREFQSNLFLNGSAVDGSWNQQYMRSNENTFWTGSSNVVLLNPTAGQNLDVGVVTREGGGIDFDVALQLVRLPAGAAAIIVESAAGDYNPTAATDFNWPNAAAYDPSADFTFSSGQTNIDVDNADDYIVIAGQAIITDAVAAVTRAMPKIQFRVNTTDNELFGHASYNRNSGTAGHASLATAGLLVGLSANDSIHVRNERLGPDVGAITNGAGAFSVLRLSTLLGITTTSGAPNLTKPTSSGSAEIEKQASAASNLTKPTSAGNLDVTPDANQSSGAPDLTKPTSAGVSEIIKPSSGAPSLVKPTTAGVVEIEKIATSASNLTKPTSAGNAINCSQKLAPDTIAAQTNLVGAVTDIDESPDAPDANWLILD